MALDKYRRHWKAQQGCWGSKPQHDDNSHCADPLRMLACRLPSVTEPSGPTSAEVDAMYAKYNLVLR